MHSGKWRLVWLCSGLLVCSVLASEARAGSPAGHWAGSPTGHWAGSPTGRWLGQWTSAPTGHQGPLRARIRQTPQGDYRAIFAGRFAGVIPFAYRAKLEPTGWPGQYVSVKRLPLIGEYRMTATITPSRFHAHFQSRKDSGVFDMRRR